MNFNDLLDWIDTVSGKLCSYGKVMQLVEFSNCGKFQGEEIENCTFHNEIKIMLLPLYIKTNIKGNGSWAGLEFPKELQTVQVLKNFASLVRTIL